MNPQYKIQVGAFTRSRELRYRWKEKSLWRKVLDALRRLRGGK